MKTITLIAKGPSANHAAQWIRDGDVAVINDAGLLVPERKLDFVFFSDGAAFEGITKCRKRIGYLVNRRLIERDTALMPQWVKQWPYRVSYHDRECDGDDASMAARIVAGGIVHHHTTTGALHWLVKHGRYRNIRVIGVDGGSATDYAGGLSQTCPGDYDLDEWRDITRRCTQLLAKVYDARFEWWKS